MKQQSVTSYMVWPLEVIDKALYFHEGRPDLKDFRKTANMRETFWIKLLKTLKPRGYNIFLPFKTKENRRIHKSINPTKEQKRKNMNSYELVDKYK